MELQSDKKALKSLLLICFLALSAIPTQAAEKQGLSLKTTVTIQNDQTNGAPVTIHCKSKDDDLGAHVVPHGTTYEFSFHPNVFSGTLFFCSFTSSYGFVEFEIYNQERDRQDRCETLCKWVVSAYGVRGFTEWAPSRNDLSFPWGK